jgi:hypothetical protein
VCIVGDDRRGAVAERRRDGALAAGLDFEQGEREPLAFLCQRASRGWKPLALGKRTLERLQALARDARLLTQRLALRAHARVEHAAGTREVGAESGRQRLRALAPKLESFARAAQAIQGGRRLLAPARRVGELFLGAPPLLEQRVELLVGMLAREQRRGAPAVAVVQALLELGEVELGNPRAQRCNLSTQLLGALRRGRLQRQGPQPLLHLGLDVQRALDLDPDARELQLGAMLAPLEAAETGGFLEQLTALLRLRAEDLLDAPLADDRVHPAAEPEVGEQLDQVDSAHGGAIEQVLPFSAAMQPASDGEVGIGHRAVALGIVEEELDLAEVLGRAAAAAREDHVVGLLRPEVGRRHRAGGPDDGVRDVGLPRAVGADDDGDAWLEADLDRLRERLEAAQLYRPQMHAPGG